MSHSKHNNWILKLAIFKTILLFLLSSPHILNPVVSEISNRNRKNATV